MTDSVTISLLPVSLALVHLPRSRLETLTQHILRQIIRPNPIFLNVTCNEIELSLFAEHHALQDFEKIAKKDARRLKTRKKSPTNDQQEVQAHSKRRRSKDWEPIEVSSDRWNALQIDSHSDQLDNSGARVRELSAPLAAAGISILYQSSYMSDFIFVKSSRLSQVMSLLASAGFDLYSSDPNNFTAQVSTFTSPLLSPATDDNSSIHLLDLNSLSSPSNQRVDPEGGAVFTRSRSSTNGTSSSSSSRGASIPPHLQMSNPHDFATDPDSSSSADEGACEDLKTPALPLRPAMSRSQSHSPSGCDVSLLVPDLTYVGLADDNVDTWSLKIVKLVAFPELILDRSGRSVGVNGRPRASSAATGFRSASAQSLYAEPSPALDTAFASTDSTKPCSLRIVTDGSEGESGSGSDTTTRVGPDSPKEDPALFDSSESPLYDIADSRPWHDDLDADADSSDEESDGASDEEDGTSERSLPDASAFRPSLAHHNTADTLRPTDVPDDAHPESRARSASVSSASSCASASPPPLVPFFSFTRTAEGSSLTAPVSLLAALFPPSERHMVICSDELDILDSRSVSPIVDVEDDEDTEDDDDLEREAQGPLRCLQIDLRKFGLDKHGLVNRFSRTLEENGINHMYNSTYKTANLLVDKAHATRAQALLRSC